MVGVRGDRTQRLSPPSAYPVGVPSQRRARRRAVFVSFLFLLVLLTASSGCAASGPGAAPDGSEPDPQQTQPDSGPSGAPSPRAEHPSDAPEPSSLDELKQVAARELEQGAIAYDVPPVMDVGRVSEVVVRISRDEDAELGEGLDQPVQEQLLVGTHIEARLGAPRSAFDIVRVGQARQALLDDHREWIWDVTPLRDGVHRLRLVVTVHHGDTELERTTLSRDITVHVGWWQARWGWFKDNYPAVVGGLAIVGAIAKLRFPKLLGVLRRRGAGTAAAAPDRDDKPEAGGGNELPARSSDTAGTAPAARTPPE